MYAKPNTVKFEDSNIANLGTELEKKVKLNAAKCEHAWDGAGSKAGSLEVWRIEKFQIVRWADKDLGKFFNGDSYIILHTYKKNKNTDALAWDVHFWLGEKTTQDEYGTAAYKTVELDDRLGGAPVQHREVQGHESPLFLSYFPNNTLEVMEGGVESGFTHVEATTYKTRLLHVKGTARAVRVVQVPLSADSLNSGDVFILDDGLKIYQWNGKQSSTYEKVKAGQVVRAMRDERGGKPVCTMHSEGDKDLAEFWSKLGGERPIKPAAQGGADEQAAQEAISQKKLFRLSDTSGKAEFTLVKSGELRKTDLDTNDVFIVDTGAEVFVWIGRKSSTAERKLGMQYAQQYIANNNLPSFLPISRVLEGGENPVFNSLFSDTIATRDLFGVESDEGFPHSCCPHSPGSNKWDFTKTQSSATTALLKQLAPRSTPGAQPAAQPEQINAAVNELFGFFANKVSTHFK